MIATDQFGDKMDAVSVGSSFLDDSEDFDIGVDEQEDLDSTIHNDATSVSGEVDKPQESIAAKESRQVAAAKRVAIVVLLVFAGAAGYVTFSFTERGLRDDFKSEFEGFANDIVSVSKDNALSTFGILRSLSNTFTSYAYSVESNSTWPFVTIPDYQYRSHDYLKISGAEMIAFSPIVSPLDVKEWTSYSANQQGWIEEGLRTSFSDQTTTPVTAKPAPIREIVWKFSDGTSNPIPDSSPIPTLPLWQMYPPPKDTTVVNYNLRSNGFFERGIALSERSKKTVLSEIFLDNELSVFDRTLNFKIPRSLVIQPVFESFENVAAVAGFLIVLVPWNIFFEAVLGEGTRPLVCVMSNSCGSTFSYRVDGPEATFLGNEDMHDPKYDEMAIVSLFPDFERDRYIGETIAKYCEYSLTIYPTLKFEDAYQNRTPFVNMTAVLAVFLMTSMLFVIYDCLVQRLKRKVVDQAQRSTAIVDSLFPQEVQDRLYKAAEESRSRKSFAPKFMLQNFLSDGAGQEENASAEMLVSSLPGQVYKTKPIADLFLECTVMFADISGFTAWSSVREPSQVFALLECIYNSFDGIARRNKVFKVETIGDCYVAVCGLPDPNSKHAVVMARFAYKCLVCMKGLMQQLEVTLGPDTSELVMRFGLHSGPVTAGVLRGEKSRFQLFGDTVNTASRMESTGQRNCIHCSEDTASGLRASGKGHWVRKREDKVVIKGKGEMQTYWLRPQSSGGGSAIGDEAETEFPDRNPALEQPTTPSSPRKRRVSVSKGRKEQHGKTQRLVDWVTNIMLPLLEQIVAQREAGKIVHPSTAPISKAEMDETAKAHSNSMALGEVQEIITLPKFDAEVAEQQAAANQVELSRTVKGQLTSLVGSLADMYHENPFHNFEHASHVTMSVGKLLARIVAPDVQAMDNEYDSLVHDHTYGITSDPMTQFAVVFAALIHDVDHPGVPNAALVKEGTPLAIRYKNKSVAEQNSVDIAWNLLMEERYTELRDCIYQTKAELKRFRQLLVNSVMATDITDKDLGSLRKARWAKAFSDEQTSLDSDVNRKATIVIEHLIQASDVAHTMQHWQVYLRWNERFFQECYQAYLNGRAEKDPSEGWYEGEIGFFDFYIIPLAKKLKECGVFGVSSGEYLNYATQNREEWERRGREVVEGFKAKHVKKLLEASEENVTSVTFRDLTEGERAQ